jgi:RNA polymerase sigma factor (TIGR02999 family)
MAQATQCGWEKGLRRTCEPFGVPMSDVTQILSAIEQGDPRAADQLLPLVYDELRRLAARRLAQEKPGQTLQPTALVHEAYLRLVASLQREHQDEPPWDSRGHFFAAAAEAMRRILVESARRKKRAKHGGDRQRVDLEDQDVPVRPRPDEILALDEALTRLAEEDPEAAQVVQLHFFAGLSIDQAAKALGVSRATAYRHWSYARAWLRCAIGGDAPEW